ncbi:hypothetical protein SGRIM119S_01446 [Streptomyces griseorubiginosus]
MARRANMRVRLPGSMGVPYLLRGEGQAPSVLPPLPGRLGVIALRSDEPEPDPHPALPGS